MHAPGPGSDSHLCCRDRGRACAGLGSFPCDPPPQACQDNPTFLVFGALPCNTESVDVCAQAQPIPSECALTCKVCQVCAEPEPIDEFQVIMQHEVVDDGIIVWAKNSVDFAGL